MINTKNCYRIVDRSIRRKNKKTLLKNGVIEGRKKRIKADRERNLWEEKSLEEMIVRVREERKKQREEKK